jgi:ATP-binding cassette subfamily B protein
MADIILFLENGQRLEMGSHEELLKLDGKYAELFHLQAAGYV